MFQLRWLVYVEYMYGEFGSGLLLVCRELGVFGFYEGVRDFVQKDGVVVQMVASFIISVNVESFTCI